MHYIPPAALVTILFLPLASHAQRSTDFSGTWSMDLSKSESSQQGAEVKPVTFVITQSPTQVRIETRRGERIENVLYPLGRTRGTTGTSGSSAAAHPEAYWQGDTLVTETQRPVSGYTVTVKEVRSLGPDGKEMTVETTVIVQHGYSMPGAKNYGTSKDVFIKATP
jgi:alkylated DNA repair dioxygenase AlkB